MKITIPEKLRVAGNDYTIDKKYEFKETTMLAGQVDLYVQQIRLRDRDPGGQPVDEQYKVASFFHELVHVIDFHYNNGGLSEEAITRLANGLYQVLADNNFLENDTE